MIKVSDSAKKRAVMLMEDDGFNATTDYIRVGVKSGGCSGLSYESKFDNALSENDKVFEDNGVKIAVDKKSVLYLAGTVLEFSGGLNGKGFGFQQSKCKPHLRVWGEFLAIRKFRVLSLGFRVNSYTPEFRNIHKKINTISATVLV